MPLIPRRPFWELERFFEEWPEKFGEEFTKGYRTPRMDIYEKGKNIVAEVELPGVDPENIDLSVKKDSLSIKAETEKRKEKKEKGYYRKELRKGYYQRVVPLPVEVKGKKAKAKYEDRVLKVTIPKAKPEEKKKKGTKVKVQSA